MDINKKEMRWIKTEFDCLENKSVEIDGVEYFTFKGYGSTFGNIDRADEVMVAGCFKKFLKQHRPSLLWQHQMSEPVGIYNVVREDEKGLYVEGRMPMTDDLVRGRVVPQMKAGSVKALSIGFTVDNYTYDEKSDILYFNEVKAWEVSLVTIPCNAEAVITDIKSFENAQNITELNQLLKNCGMSGKKCNIIISKIKSFVRDEQNTGRDVQSELRSLIDDVKKLNWR